MTQEYQDQRLDLSFTRTTKDMAVAGLVGAVVASLLIVFVYFTFKDDVDDTTHRLSAMESRVVMLESQVATLNDLPAEVQRAVIRETLRDLSRNGALVESQIQDAAQQEKVTRALQLIREVEQEFQ